LDRSVRVWDLIAGGEGRLFFGHTDSVLSVAFSSDGKQLAGGGANGEIRVWHTATGRETALIRQARGIGALAFSPDGGRLFAVNAKGHRNGGTPSECRVWEIAAGQEVHTLEGHMGTAWSVAFSPDSKLLASSGDNTVRVWDPGQRRLLKTLEGHTRQVYGIAFSPNGKQIASASSDKTVKIWDVVTGHNVLTLKGHAASVWNVAFHPTAARIASASEDCTVKIWDTLTGQEIRTFQRDIKELAEFRFATVAFSPDGRLLVGVGDDDLAWIWNADTGEKLATLKGHEGSVWHATFSKDGSLLATSSTDGTVKIWDVSTRHLQRTIQGSSTFMSSAFSPDSQRLATTGGGGKDHPVKLWDLTNGQELLTLQGGTNIVMFSPDGHYLAAAGHDGKVRLWDARPIAPDHEGARDYNDQAWLMATRFEDHLRDPGRAVQLAQMAVDLAPTEGNFWNTLGIAKYRAGKWTSAIEALTRSMELLKGQMESFNTLFLAMACWKLDDKEKARQWYDRAVQWMEENKEQLEGNNQWQEELGRFRAEAAELLGIKDEKPHDIDTKDTKVKP
jgi:WD40 repeat protein